MKPSLSILWSILLLLSINVQAQEKWSKVKIKIQSAEQRTKVIRLLQLDHFSTEGNYIICEVAQQELSRLKPLSIKYDVLVPDVAADLYQKNRMYDQSGNGQSASSRFNFDASCKTVAGLIAKPAAFHTNGQMGGYYNLAEMNAAMNTLAANYPTLVQKFSIGKSVENRDIWAIKISDNVATDEAEPEVMYSGLQHAREAITGTSLIFFMQYLLENYSTNTRVQNLVNNRELFIIPCVNPDGYYQNQMSNPTGGGTWRKNKNMAQGDGVDLNRNYSVDWGRSPGGSADPGNDTYWGLSAFSEPETQAMRSFITSRNFVAAIDQHCFGDYYSLPFGFASPHTLSAEDQNFYNYIPALMGKYNCHRAGNSVQTVGYEVAGGIKDYFVLGDIGVGTKQKVLGMTGEAGGGGFWAPKSEIISLCQGLCFQNLQLATAAGSYADITDDSDIELVTKSGSFSFTARRIGIGSDPISVSLIPLENIQSVGTPVTTTLNTYFQTTSNAISYTLPSNIVNGTRIKFAWKVETGGIITYDTITKFYVPNVIFSDNMEGALDDNWDDGKGGGDKWSFTSESAFQGVKSLTESALANYAANDERIVTYKNTFSLTATTAAYLSFWVKHRAENCKDKLQVQVSTNVNTWTPVCGKNTIAEYDGTLNGLPALTGIREIWTRELYDLSAYVNNANVRFRFVFTSNADASTDDFYKKVDDGFYIDNVKLIKSSAAFTTLPVTFIDFTGKMNENGTVALYWEAYTDNEHDHFEVERSADGFNYTMLGRGRVHPPYDYIDKHPLQGLNYYRIKQTDKDGKISYSKVITINAANKLMVSVFPNPVKDELHVKMNGEASDKLRIEITDIQGRRLLEKEAINNSIGADLVIPAKSWKPQLYILKVFDSRGQLLTTQKLMKL